MDRDQINARILAITGEIDGLDLGTTEGRASFDRLEAEERTLRTALRRIEEQASGSAEEREWASVVAGLRMSDYMSAAVSERSLTGRAQEVHEEHYRGAVGASLGGVAFPMDLLAERAGETSLAATGATEAVQFVQRRFRPPLAAWFGVSMPRVPAGESKFVVITGGPAGTERAKGVAEGNTEIAHSVIETKPQRISVRATIRDEDALRNPGFEMAVSGDLRMALGSALDREILEDIRGGAVVADDDTAAITAATMFGKAASLIEGVFASMLSDIRLILGPATYVKLAEAIYASTEVDALTKLKMAGVECRVTSETDIVPAESGMLQKILARRGMDMRDGAAPVWETGRMIRDPYSEAASGEVAITVHAFFGKGNVLRAGGFQTANAKLS